jgi:hypothetical protein
MGQNTDFGLGGLHVEVGSRRVEQRKPWLRDSMISVQDGEDKGI